MYSVYSRGVRREKCCRNNIYRLLFIFIQLFIGSSNAHEMTYVSLGAAIFGRHFRIVPQSWYRHICMRVELNGCQGGQMLYMSSASNVTSLSLRYRQSLLLLMLAQRYPCGTIFVAMLNQNASGGYK